MVRVEIATVLRNHLTGFIFSDVTQFKRRHMLKKGSEEEGAADAGDGGASGCERGKKKKKKKKKKDWDVYNIWYSRVVTLPSTNQTISRLTAMSGTGMGTFDCVWS